VISPAAVSHGSDAVASGVTVRIGPLWSLSGSPVKLSPTFRQVQIKRAHRVIEWVAMQQLPGEEGGSWLPKSDGMPLNEDLYGFNVGYTIEFREL
jgi:hypothetical protein